MLFSAHFPLIHQASKYCLCFNNSKIRKLEDGFSKFWKIRKEIFQFFEYSKNWKKTNEWSQNSFMIRDVYSALLHSSYLLLHSGLIPNTHALLIMPMTKVFNLDNELLLHCMQAPSLSVPEGAGGLHTSQPLDSSSNRGEPVQWLVAKSSTDSLLCGVLSTLSVMIVTTNDGTSIRMDNHLSSLDLEVWTVDNIDHWTIWADTTPFKGLYLTQRRWGGESFTSFVNFHSESFECAFWAKIRASQKIGTLIDIATDDLIFLDDLIDNLIFKFWSPGAIRSSIWSLGAIWLSIWSLIWSSIWWVVVDAFTFSFQTWLDGKTAIVRKMKYCLLFSDP